MPQSNAIDINPEPTYGYPIEVCDDRMSPRYLRGETAYFHPVKPLTTGCYVFVQMKPNAQPKSGSIKRLVKWSGNKVILQQSNPHKTFTLKADDILSMRRVIGCGDSN
jgi:phage repressor protein C with HTH and peptisase S24 domain